MKSLKSRISLLNNVSIGTRLALISSGVVLAIFAVVSVVIYTVTSRTMAEKSNKSLQTEIRLLRDVLVSTDRMARTGADKTAEVFGSLFQGSFDLDRSATVKVGSADAPVIRAGGATLNNNFTQVDQFTKMTKGSVATIFAKKGEDLIRVTTSLTKEDGSRALGTSLDREHPGYQRIMSGQEYLGKATLFGKDYMTKYTPIKDKSGSVIGALFVGFDITDDMKALVKEIKELKVGDTGYVFVLDTRAGKNKGTMVMHPALQGTNVLDAKDADGKELFKDILAKNEGLITYGWKNPGETFARKKMAAFTEFKEWNWMIVASAYASEVNKEVTQMAWSLGVAGFLGALILSTVIFFVIKRTLRPLKEMVPVANRLAEGDLTVQLSYNRTDEIGQVYGAMRGMVGRLRDIVGNIKSAAESVASGSEELSASAEQISRGMGDQNGRATQIAASSEEMSQTIVDIAKNASSIAESANGTADTAVDGERIVKESVDKVKTIATSVEESGIIMRKLSDSSKKIGDIINVINDIAEQTNLLALNAAIEAARAGEQGRGFAVVADEVRKLAEKTSHSTTEIGGMIKEMQSEVVNAAGSMTRATGQVEEGVKLSSTAGDSLQRIVSSVGSLQSMVQQIATATEEMSTASDHINSDIQGIAAAAREMSSGTDQISQSSSELARLASELNVIVGRFKT